MCLKMGMLLAGVSILSGVSLAQAEESVEVLHYWTSGGEAAALNLLKENLQSQGIGWVDMPVAGGAGEAAMTTLRARVTAGNPPAAVQMQGFDILDWAQQGVLGNLDEVADKEGWDKVIPPAIQHFSKYDGHWIAAPVNVHSTNWAWYNKAALNKAGGKVPQNWDELIALLDKFKEQGITPIAHGGQPWQEALIFTSVVMSFGPDFYKKALIDLDPEALKSDTMKQVFERMAKLHTYVDDNFSGRDWNLASAMVIDDKAGVQFMGDWAKGEFTKAGKKPGVDFVCGRFPGTDGSVAFNADQFAVFEVGQNKRKAQLALATAVEDVNFQSAFNVVKGSAPARTDVPTTAFDECGQKAIKDLAAADKSGSLLGSFSQSHAQPTAIKNAMFDVITRQFNGQLTVEQAVEELSAAIEIAK